MLASVQHLVSQSEDTYTEVCLRVRLLSVDEAG